MWYKAHRGNAQVIVRFVMIRGKPGHEKSFEEATTENHRGSVGEPGCLRFDVLKDTSQEGLYYLHEMYQDEVATAAHKEAAWPSVST
jgi:(4S)-4-hydroxy-5-phosphonooxypentane-2,3-dione isomerase